MSPMPIFSLYGLWEWRVGESQQDPIPRLGPLRLYQVAIVRRGRIEGVDIWVGSHVVLYITGFPGLHP